MPRNFDRGSGHWRQYRGEWWSQAPPGSQAWQGFGRRIFIRFLAFLGFVVLVVVGLGTLIATLIPDVTGFQAVLLVLAAPFVFILTMGLLGRLFFRSWRPVRQLISAAGALADGDYSARVDANGSPAMRQVTASFNDMARRLETADEQRRRLLADLGHELRTPLTVVRGEIEAMLDGVHQPDQDNLEMLMGEVRVMERLLEDLRTLSLIEAGALALHPEPTEIVALVEDVAEAHQRRAAEAGVSVEVHTGTDPIELLIDPVRIREVLANLGSNALRASADGGMLTFRVRRVERRVVIEVADTGVGIEPEEIDEVFERFHKGSTSRGSGLGLTISRDLVEAHGGSITLESQAGIGTTARVSLPYDGT
ncbi:MAG: ATP-binding protein [Acidimicrobiia bacterium]|nr:ATP-binding protein [Acidimicrobiia bacterium]